MSIQSLLVHSCTIQRRNAGVNDSGEDDGTYSDLATGVACRLSQLSERETAGSAAGAATMGASVAGVVTHKMFMEYGQDITEKDRVADVVNQNGTTIMSLGEVEGVNRDPGGMQSHVEVLVREVRPS